MKMMKLIIPPAALALIVACAFVVITGCEDEPSMSTEDVGTYASDNSERVDQGGEAYINITPEVVTIEYVGQEVDFTVTGSEGPFSWSLGSTTYGSLAVSQNNERQAVYTASSLAPNTVYVEDGEGHLDSVTMGAQVPDLTIIPEGTITFTSGFAATNAPGGNPTDLTGMVVSLRVVGGAEPYGTWRASSPGLGTVASTGTETATVTINGNNGVGNNVISITDALGNYETVTITLEFSE